MEYGNNDKNVNYSNNNTNSNNDYSFQLFSNVLITLQKSNVAVYQEHIKLRKEVPKSSQSAG